MTGTKRVSTKIITHSGSRQREQGETDVNATEKYLMSLLKSQATETGFTLY